MKRLLVLLMVCILLLTGCTGNEEATQYWWGIQEHISVSVHLFQTGMVCGLWMRKHFTGSEMIILMDLIYRIWTAVNTTMAPGLSRGIYSP